MSNVLRNVVDSIPFPTEGPFDDRYRAFLEVISALRPKLHRYCARMTGSTMDGEDVVQEALFDAYRKLESWDDGRRLEPWLFRIAHNRCIDFLRQRGVRMEADAIAFDEPEWVEQPEIVGRELDHAFEHLLSALPPMERACLLLKDVFDYSLQESAELVGSTVGGVKSALSRGRSKLATLPPFVPSQRPQNPELTRLLSLYVERFNKRDWDGVRELIAADARLLVADRFHGALSTAPYFAKYEEFIAPWHLAVGEAEGQAVVVRLCEKAGQWEPESLIRIHVVADRVVDVTDYAHCPWVLRNVNLGWSV